MAEIIIPTPLRKFTDNVNKFSTSAKTVGDAIAELTGKYPGLKEHIYGSDGQVRSFIKVFVGEDDIKYLQDTNTSIGDGTVVSIVPAIAGGK
ncbi:MAG: MoaD/ThiS family protein [Chitinophagales bacterium]|nr:MoaD/ThiS family protein [Chitinophagales bacterium]